MTSSRHGLHKGTGHSFNIYSALIDAGAGRHYQESPPPYPNNNNGHHIPSWSYGSWGPEHPSRQSGKSGKSFTIINIAISRQFVQMLTLIVKVQMVST